MVRDAVVAGQFYPDSPEKLNEMLRGFIKENTEKTDCAAVVSPHAGYVFSGAVAGETFSGINTPRDILILAPNHTGRGTMISLYPGEAWKTPLGQVPVNRDFNNLLIKTSEYFEEDELAHLQEHSAEVQLPFLQYIRKDIRISVVVIATQNYEILSDIGNAISTAIKEYGQDILVVASSDMTHFEAEENAKKQDRLAIEKIEAMDPEGLLNVVMTNRISMCGVAPVTATLIASKGLGAESAELVRYTTSAEASGDRSNVVGYAGFIIN